MAVKRGKHMRIDSGTLTEFEKIAKKKKKHQNQIIEEMMEEYITRDGQMLTDDLYAPRIAEYVKKAVDGQINRLAKMIYKTQVESTASLYANPLLHNQILAGVEEILEEFLHPQLLDQNRTLISKNYTLDKNGKVAVNRLRKVAHTDHEEQKEKKREKEQSQ